MAHLRDVLWESGHDETVEVNQRALIDKVLARYSGEFTVFRELLQNSDDAGSSAVEIHFETKSFVQRKQSDGEGKEDTEIAHGTKKDLPDLKTVQVHQWRFMNNGQAFRDEDWSRLKKIAEGNPDEEKIGAFGVGFYSLFSVTEDPFVTSGEQWMGFYWKGDQLLARRGALSTGSDPWTTFLLALREPSPLPPAFDFTRFLSSSITFMTHLREISVYLDDKRLARLVKTPGQPKPLGIPKGLKSSSPVGAMTVKGIQATPLHIKAEVLRWVYSVGTEKPPPVVVGAKQKASGSFFSSLLSSFAGSSTPSRTPTPAPLPPPKEVDLLEISESNVTLSIFAADVDVRLDKKLEKELYRSTKKNPPSKLRYELIYTGKDEYDESRKEDEKYPYTTGSIFQGLRADLEGTGSARIFIGHATAQTTGIGGHMSARFIPTVERESIDLMDRNVAIWNKELLYVGGFLARSAYTIEMDTIRELWNASSLIEVQSRLRNRGLHLLKFFTFHASTPSSTVSQVLQEAFFSSGTNQPFPIMSSAGVRNITDVRMPDPVFAAFLQQLPVIPDEVVTQAKLMIDVLQERRLLKDIMFDDVLKELKSRPLSESETVACLKWWITVHKSGASQNVSRIRKELLEAVVMSTGTSGGADERVLSLSAIQTFLNPKQSGAVIPVDGPLPEHLCPLSVSKNFDPETLVATFSWRELGVLDWLRHITMPGVCAADIEHDLTKSSHWAERVLSGLSRGWSSLAQNQQKEIVTLLKGLECIPTTSGLRRPDQVYFSNVNLFGDLPIVTMPSGTPVKGQLEKLLQALGVRKHVDLQLVFNRMIKTGDWTIADLTKYLVTVQSTLTPEEISRLKNTSAFPREKYPSETPEQGKATRYKASDLYEPLDVFRDLKLPVLDWSTTVKWRNSSEEAKFLYRLGLLRFPPLDVIINLAASSDVTIRKLALKYFLDNFATRYSEYDSSKFADKAFIPDMGGLIAKPSEVFGNPEWALLGFRIVDESLRNDALTKLKIQEHPPASLLVSLLERTPPTTEAVARQWFGVLSTRVSGDIFHLVDDALKLISSESSSAFSPNELKKLSHTPIVPTKQTAGEKASSHMLPPGECYFAGESSEVQLHSRLFVYVDFGAHANSFLSACGTKNKPSVDEIARKVLTNPREFYHLAGHQNFITELRNLAANRRLISTATFNQLKRSPILLGSRRVPKASTKTAGNAITDWDEEDWAYEYDLRRPDQIVIADDINFYRLFGEAIFTAPQEDILEEFYTDLGSSRLSGLVREDYKTSNEIRNSKIAQEIRACVLERLPLFLHEHTHQKPRITYSWLNSADNFVVRIFGKLVVTKSMKYENKPLFEERDASAAAKRDGNGPIQLWLAGNTQVDMYEVATSLCNLIFPTPKKNDALLFMTILSTDLKALKRRGYNVDRILKQQQAEREAAYNAAREKFSETALVSDSAPDLPPKLPSSNHPAHIAPAKHENPTDLSLPGHSTPTSSLEDVMRDHKEQQRTPSSMPSTLQNMMRRFNQQRSQISPSAPAGPSRPNSGLLPAPPSTVTPLSNISANIETAIKACKEEKSDLLNNRRQMQTVKETLNEGYCDVSGYSRDLLKAGDMGDMPVFVSPDVLDQYNGPKSLDSKRTDPRRDFLNAKHDTLARFIHIVHPLRDVYKLPAKSLHIFYDLAGELIAFNREGSIYLNLRYFEAWHDEDVGKGNLSTPFISWYFTLAHEIAHNLVQPHNSEHEFYFSAICEQYLVPFANLIC